MDSGVERRISTATSKSHIVRDCSKVSAWTVFFVGVVAAIGVLIAILTLQMISISMFDLRIKLEILTSTRWLGFLVFVLGGGSIAFVYAMMFRSAHRSGTLVGLNLALFHWLVAGLLAAPLSNEGLFFARDGFPSFVSFFMLHLIYGAIVGELFDRAAMRGVYPKPMVSVV